MSMEILNSQEIKNKFKFSNCAVGNQRIKFKPKFSDFVPRHLKTFE